MSEDYPYFRSRRTRESRLDPNEVFLVFDTEEDALLFREWLNATGQEDFLDWAKKRVEFLRGSEN